MDLTVSLSSGSAMATARPVPPRKLPRGSHALDPEAVARDQRRRLQEAIVHVAATRGYANITVNDVSLAASVSRNTFHQRFDDLQACLTAAWEATVTDAIQAAQGLQASRQTPPDSVRAALQRVLRALTSAVIARPDHARLVIVEVLSIGRRNHLPPSAGPPPRSAADRGDPGRHRGRDAVGQLGDDHRQRRPTGLDQRCAPARSASCACWPTTSQPGAPAMRPPLRSRPTGRWANRAPRPCCPTRRGCLAATSACPARLSIAISASASCAPS